MAAGDNTLVPAASAKISMRIAPDEHDLDAFELLKAHLEAHAPWGAQISVTLDDRGNGFAAHASGPIYDEARAAFTDAWGVEPVDIGVGGSIRISGRCCRALEPRLTIWHARHAASARQAFIPTRRIALLAACIQ